MSVRVSFLIDALSRAGTETQLLALIRALDRRKVQPSLVLLDGDSPESQSLEPDDCPVLRLGVKSLKNLPTSIAAAARLRRFWREQRADVVQTYFLDSTYFGVPLARACGIHRVIRVRNNVGHWLTPTHRHLGRVVGKLAHATLTNSEPGKRALLASEGGPTEKVVVLENGVDLAPFAAVPSPVRRGMTTIGTVANLRPVKGVDLFIRAAGMLASERGDVRFLIAGDGEQRGELQQLIDDLGLARIVTLAGRVADVPAFLGQLDVAVLPSRAEGMSNALLEMMAAGRPVVATDVGANAQLLDSGRLGLIVPPEDASALATAMQRLMNEGEFAASMARAAREHVGRAFNRDQMRERFEQFYLRLCA